MPSPLDKWDLERYREILRVRGILLLRNPKVRVRFDESDLANITLLRAHKKGDLPDGSTEDIARRAWLEKIQDNALNDPARFHNRKMRDVNRQQDLGSLKQAQHESSAELAQLARDGSAFPDEKVSQREEEERAELALRELPSPQREIIRLRFQFDMKYPEIKDFLDLSQSPEAIAALCSRGMMKLRQKLESDPR